METRAILKITALLLFGGGVFGLCVDLVVRHLAG